MVLTIGLLALIISMFGAGLAVRIVRNPRLPDWIRDGFIGSIYLPLLTGVIAVGLGHVAYGAYQLVYGYVSLLTPDTLYGGLLAAALMLGLRWPPAKQVIFGRPELASSVQPKPELTVVQTPVSVLQDHEQFRPAA